MPAPQAAECRAARRPAWPCCTPPLRRAAPRPAAPPKPSRAAGSLTALPLEAAADEHDPLAPVFGAGALHHEGVAPASELHVRWGQVEKGRRVLGPGNKVRVVFV